MKTVKILMVVLFLGLIFVRNQALAQHITGIQQSAIQPPVAEQTESIQNSSDQEISQSKPADMQAKIRYIEALLIELKAVMAVNGDTTLLVEAISSLVADLNPALNNNEVKGDTVDIGDTNDQPSPPAYNTYYYAEKAKEIDAWVAGIAPMSRPNVPDWVWKVYISHLRKK